MPFDGPSGYTAALRYAATALRPPPRLSVSQWAGKHRVLPSGKSSEGGQWNNDRIPYLRGVMDALNDDHPAPLVVFMKSSQVGGSECGINWIGRTIHHAPTSILALFPSEKDARKWVRNKVNPMLALTPELRRLLPPGRRSDDGNTLLEKHFPGGVLFTGSANIPTDVASISVAYVLLDEVDRMPAVLDGEGDPIDLAKRRTATFARRKIFEISSPTTEEASRIDADYALSTQDRYHVPCHHCDTRQVLTFDNLIWPDGKPKLAVYQCEHCENEIEERRKTDMLAGGEWRARFPEREASIKGFHINGLYTPIGLGDSWAEHAEAWELARGKPARIQVFFNTRRGETVKSERVKIEWEAVASRREPIKQRSIPPGVLTLTIGADVQVDRIEALILGHGRNSLTVPVDHVQIAGDPMHPQVWSELDDYIARELINSYGRTMRVACTLIDSGYLQHEVTNFTRTRRARHIFAAKGSKVPTRQPIGRPTLVDIRRNGEVHENGAEQYQIGVGVLKTTLYARLKSDEQATPAERLCRIPEWTTDEFLRQLCAEVRTPRGQWEKVYDRNEALDIYVLGLAAGMHHTVRIDKMNEADWLRLEELYEPQDAKPVSPGDAPKLGREAIPLSGGFVPMAARVNNR